MIHENWKQTIALETQIEVQVCTGDEFKGVNEGLLVAEVELENEKDKVELPGWIGQEVSDDARYYNSCLVKLPFNFG